MERSDTLILRVKENRIRHKLQGLTDSIEKTS